MTNVVSQSSFNATSVTGSWANATHSVVWMTRGDQHGFNSTQRLWPKHFMSLAIILLLMWIAQSNLLDVYGTPMAWMAAALPSAVLGTLIALAGQVPVLRLWWQLVFLATSQFIIGPVIALNSTAIAHVIPSLETLSQGWNATFGSFKYLISIEPPIGAADGSLMAAWTIGLWLSFLAGLFVFNPNTWLALLSTLPLGAAMAVCALLGTSTGWHRIASGMAFTIVLIVWMSWRLGFMEWGRWLSALIIVLIAMATALAGTWFIPQHRLVLRDLYDPPISPYDYTSPLSGMRSYIKDHKDDVLLTVKNLPAGTPVRLAVMDRFDGSVWNLSDSTEAADSSNYRRIGTSIATDEHGKSFTATFTVHNGLNDTWLPLAGAATSVRFSAHNDADTFYYNSGTDSAIFSSGTRNGMTYTESGIIPANPSNTTVSKAPAAHISQPPAQDVPDSVSKFATAIAGGQASGGAAAQALATTLKDSGWFSHGLQGDYPSQAGHGNYRINKLLSGTAMVGDSEQYASAMALMARELGLPSRVVMGFLPKDDDGSISDARTTIASDHATEIEFTGNDIAAWVEIKLKNLGWVAFYPTPKETKLPDADQNLTPPNPQTLVRQPPVPLTDPLRDQAQAKGQSSLSGADADDQATNPIWIRFWSTARTVVLYGSPLWVIMLICGVILSIKALLLARARRYGAPQTRVASGWNALCALAMQSGISIAGTRRAQAAAIAQQLDTSADALRDLSQEADYATFSGQPIDAHQANRYWARVDAVRKSMLRSLPRLRRIATRLSLRGVRILAHKHTSRTRAETPRNASTRLTTRRCDKGKTS
ncbi:DUF3488 and transglutaminase-like domain-containing protein [Bifidobacterium felsineum]|uniref:Transglutaminase n=1 Tax=Bifidobacterium felsineum TaxID=2045440 RepID=A0A2M9HJG2_9BIFI|nr:transglutaminase domain-containing protein [Bifidobacterium felsineum]MBT1164296.1 transglutaminase domain-containing protein [Bifidobacterium felsineum]PJM76949.1 transglutaminase [Bifidobacterium felsineum]